MMQVIPEWHITISFKFGIKDETYLISANNVFEVFDWVSKISFGTKVITNVTIYERES